MTRQSEALSRLCAGLSAIRQLSHIAPHPHPLHRGLLSAVACSLPAFIGALSGRFMDGLLACMGALVILYFPEGTLKRRMSVLLSCSLIFALSFALGSLAAVSPVTAVLSIGALTILSSLLCKVLSIGPPGNFFFIMLASVATVIPGELTTIPARTALIIVGSLCACGLAFLYSLLLADSTEAPPLSSQPATALPWTLYQGIVVAGAYALALALSLDNPYWVPISCAAVLQGGQVSLIWTRKIQRIVGTALGLGIAWMLFS
ncbi:MAG: FUSC family protein, partial [Oceanospirillales bacterium]|nr:FUSC family protein [Oceanospirillales bacterium]